MSDETKVDSMLPSELLANLYHAQGVIAAQTLQGPDVIKVEGHGRIAVMNADNIGRLLALATARIEQLEREIEQLIKGSAAPPAAT